VTYRVYIKKDYKNKVERVDETSSHLYFFKIGGFLTLIILAYFMFGSGSSDRPESVPVISSVNSNTPETAIIDSPQITNFDANSIEQQNINDELFIDAESETVQKLTDNAYTLSSDDIAPDENETIDPWQSITVKTGDSLALIFSRLSLSPSSLYNIMTLGKEVSKLKKIKPGQILNFHIEDNEVLGLKYEMSLTKTLSISKDDNKFKSEVIEIELEKVVKNTNAIINDSLFLSAKRAGLTDNLIMQLVGIYGWDIDFALDIREGDSFTVIYEEQYKDGVKVSDGPIIAAEFVNRNTALRTVRYTHENGRVDYYADNGDAMRKAFLRTPVEFARISSRFNLKRKHPILNKIRAHRGVDYAASTGTPIKATGDATVIHAGRKGGYGRTVILKHGGKYSTVYAHLHRYAKGVRSGKRVKQGQIIGYVGKSGLATGPHLHYEFRVNGVHRNPLTVKLPKAESISKKTLPEFKTKTNPMLVELDRLTGKSAIAVQQSETPINLASPKMEDG
jgi:murein DD-endopeptidase MepM/ murein hydrolase activator NlpD